VPASYLLISELVYDGLVPEIEGDEFVELYNPQGIGVSLAGYKIGDEETPGGSEGMYSFPAEAMIPAGGLIIVARNAAAFQIRFGTLPDFELRASGSGYTDTATVPNLERYRTWGRGEWALSNTGDEILLLGPRDELVDAVAYKGGNFAALKLAGRASAPAPRSLQRVEILDSDDMTADFVVDNPNPGWLTRLPAPPPVPFSPDMGDGFHAFWGCLHSHSTYSDGAGPPLYAYAVARANGLHFLALTDHSQMFDEAGWTALKQAAEAATQPGAFVALRGFEWSSREQGHISVYASADYVSRDVEPYGSLAGFYTWLTEQPDAVVAQFNHPGWPYGDNFGSFAYHSDAARHMVLVEVGNGSGKNYRTFEGSFLDALAAGWHVAPANNGDTETPDWGADTPHRTGLLAPALTPADLLAALQARRVWATEDDNLALALRTGQTWMGGTVSVADRRNFTAVYADPDGEPVRLVLHDRTVPVAETNLASAVQQSWSVEIPVASGHYYWLKAQQADGDVAYSAPIWISGPAIPDTVMINEFLASPRAVDWDGNGVADYTDEWIELYNPGLTPVDLKGWQLDDGPDGSKPYLIPAGIIYARGFLVFYRTQTWLALNDSNDWVRLFRPDGTLSDAFYYNRRSGYDRSWCRTVDGAGVWVSDWPVTMGGPNHPWPRQPKDGGVEATPTSWGAPAQVNIATARTLLPSLRVVVAGQVTVPPPLFGNSIYIQDESGGIQLYLMSGEWPALSLGDRIQVAGQTADYHGEREIRVSSVEDVVQLGPGDLPTPVVIRTGEVGEGREGQLVQVYGAVTRWSTGALYLDDGSGEVKIHIKQSTGIRRPWVERGQFFSAIGIVSQYAEEMPYEGGYRLLPRLAQDLIPVPSYLPVTGDG